MIQSIISSSRTAALNGCLEMFRRMFERVAEKNPKDPCGRTPLHYAACNGHLSIVKVILQYLSTTEKNPADGQGDTPLHKAARNGHTDVCKLIIGIINDKNPRNFWRETPKDLAEENQS